MKTGASMAAGMAAGYLLGRRRRMRLAIMLGGAALTGGLGAAGGQLLRKGTKLLADSDLGGELSPALGEITDTIRSDLLEAGKQAALAAVSSQIDSLSGALHDRAEALRHPEDLARGVAGRVPLGGEGGEEAEEGEERERPERRAPVSRVSRRRPPRPRRAPAGREEEGETGEEGEPEEEPGGDEEAELEEEEEEEEAPRVRARSRHGGPRRATSPVRRPRR